MRRERKDSVRRGSKVELLCRVAQNLRHAWLEVDRHRGADHLAEPIERAVDAVEAELRELGVKPASEDEDQVFERLEGVDAPAGEEVAP